jgi:SAM-dependent methyltransferase
LTLGVDGRGRRAGERDVDGPSRIDAVNQTRYASAALPREYARSEGLQAPERVLLALIEEDVRETPMLDLGVGAGRTTRYLRSLSDDYLGVDYSPTMVAACQRRYPDARFAVLDARCLREFEAEQFGLVMFSFNGLDCIDHRDRMDVLVQVRRILRPGGWFVFSSHNRDAPVERFHLPPLYGSRNPARLAVRAGAWTLAAARAARNRRRHRHDEYETESYAIRNDQAHEYSLLTYYVRVVDQFAQLREAGFVAPPSAYALDGRRLEEGETCRDAWVYYAVRR